MTDKFWTNARAFIGAFLFCALFIGASTKSAGHPGGLNAEKCHFERISNRYHCHNLDSDAPSVESDQPRILAFDRSQYGFRSRGSKGTIGFYSEEVCEDAETDHVVALADAHSSGASSWPQTLKQQFANDPENLVWACPSANRSKGSSGPFDYVRKNSDGLGVDGTLKDVCKFALRYKDIKAKYGLKVDDKDGRIIAECEDNVGK